MSARLAIVAVAACLAGGCALPAGAPSVYGRDVRSTRQIGWNGKAELLAVSPESIWVMRAGTVVATPVVELGTLRVVKHRFGAGTTFRFMTVVGVASALGLTVACGMAEGGPAGGCAIFGGGWILANMAVGGILAWPMHHWSMTNIRASDTEALRAYARYPQGLPDALRAGPRR